MARVRTQNAHDALALDDLALAADGLDRRSNFHDALSQSCPGFPGVEDGLVRTQGPLSVTAMVCSKWAERLRSLVTAVHPSSSTSTSGEPAFTIGSTAMTRPRLMR